MVPPIRRIYLAQVPRVHQMEGAPGSHDFPRPAHRRRRRFRRRKTHAVPCGSAANRAAAARPLEGTTRIPVISPPWSLPPRGRRRRRRNGGRRRRRWSCRSAPALSLLRFDENRGHFAAVISPAGKEKSKRISPSSMELVGRIPLAVASAADTGIERIEDHGGRRITRGEACGMAARRWIPFTRAELFNQKA